MGANNATPALSACFKRIIHAPYFLASLEGGISLRFLRFLRYRLHLVLAYLLVASYSLLRGTFTSAQVFVQIHLIVDLRWHTRITAVLYKEKLFNVKVVQFLLLNNFGPSFQVPGDHGATVLSQPWRPGVAGHPRGRWFSGFPTAWYSKEQNLVTPWYSQP